MGKSRVRLASGPVLAALGAAVAVRLTSLHVMAFPDEGGLLLVARRWSGGGPGLYGSLWVDRPPLLLAFWKVSDLLGGVVAARLLAVVAAGGIVLLAAAVGRRLGGARGRDWGAVVAAALATSPLLGGREVNAELLGAPWVLLCCLAALKAAAPSPPGSAGLRWAVLAGASGASAALVKQNLLDGLVFAAAMVLASALTRACPWRRAGRVLGAGLLGVSLPVAGTLVWATGWTSGVRSLVETLYGFRAEAARVIAEASTAAPEQRLIGLVVLALASGLLTLFAAFGWQVWSRRLGRDPVVLATLVMLAYGLFGISAGLSYWNHYLLQLLPVAVLAAAIVAGGRGTSRVSRAALSVPAVATVVAAALLVTGTAESRTDERAVVRWLDDARRPGDTGVVTYGHANILVATRIRATAYPYLWSLPLRVHDPQLDLLSAHLRARPRPTWVIEWNPVDSWDLDRSGRVAAALEVGYRPVAEVCGVPLYLRNDVQRALPPLPRSC